MCTPSPNNRTRWAPSDAQRLTLENSYANSAFPDLAARQALANDLSIEARQVQVWFQNRRQKAKKNGATANMPTVLSHGSSPVHITAQPERTPTPPSPAADYHQSANSASLMMPPPLATPSALAAVAAGLAEELRSPAAPAVLSSFGNLVSRGTISSPLLKFPSPVERVQLEQQQRRLLERLLVQQQQCGPNIPAHDLSLERELTGHFSQIVRSRFNASAPASKPIGISKSQGWKCRGLGPGIPMDRRAVSMDALEVLSSSFSV